MVISPDCRVHILGRRPSRSPITCHGRIIEDVNKTRLLGIPGPAAADFRGRPMSIPSKSQDYCTEKKIPSADSCRPLQRFCYRTTIGLAELIINLYSKQFSEPKTARQKVLLTHGAQLPAVTLGGASTVMRNRPVGFVTASFTTRYSRSSDKTLYYKTHCGEFCLRIDCNWS